MKISFTRIISIVFITSLLGACQKPDGNDPAGNEPSGSGKLKYFLGTPEQGGVQFIYDDQGRVSLIRNGRSNPSIDSYFVYYTNNIPTRLIRGTKSTNRGLKTPMFLVRDNFNNVVRVVSKYAVKPTDDIGNVNPLFNNENDPYFTTYTPAADDPHTVERVERFFYNSKNLYLRNTISTTNSEFGYASGDTIPNSFKYYYIDPNGNPVVQHTSTIDSVFAKNLNPLYDILKDIPVLDIYVTHILPINQYSENQSASFLTYSKYLPQYVYYNRVSGLLTQDHYKYDYDALGRVLKITDRSTGNVTSFVYY